MSVAINEQRKGLDGFRSPVRVLAAFFKESRDKWKQKYMDAKKDLKRLTVRVADVCKSRDTWKEKAEAKQQQLQALQSEMQQLQSQLEEASGAAPPGQPQKTRLPPAEVSSRCRTIHR